MEIKIKCISKVDEESAFSDNILYHYELKLNKYYELMKLGNHYCSIKVDDKIKKYPRFNFQISLKDIRKFKYKRLWK